MRSPAKILLISLTLAAAGCKSVPSDVIQPDDMAALMADIHVAEAVVDMNHISYSSDSLKLTMRESVYMRHGVDAAKVDSSIAWYGRNIKYYMEVCDKTIEILEHRLIETGNRIAADNALSIAGDSVDVWPNARFISINDRLPSKLITFSFGRDPNWQRGDTYSWRAKFFNVDSRMDCVIGMEYADGTVEWRSDTQDSDGWREFFFQTDSLREPTRLFGYLAASNRKGTEMRLDSISLVRKRINPNDYMRSFTTVIQAYNEPVEVNAKLPNDSI